MKGAVSEMTLAVGSLVATLIIVIAVWQLFNYQTSELERSRTEQMARDVAKDINFVQQISSPYKLFYDVQNDANISVKNGYVEVSRKNTIVSFPIIGIAGETNITAYTGQRICVRNAADADGIVRVGLC